MKIFNHYTQNHEVTYNVIKEVVSKLTHHQKVEFALFCAKDCFHLNNENTKELLKKCIDLREL